MTVVGDCESCQRVGVCNNHTLIGSTAVVAAAGITYRELDYWIREGAIEPEIDAEGSGRPRFFTVEQADWVCRIAAARALAEAHGITFSVQTIGAMWTALAAGGTWRLILEV